MSAGMALGKSATEMQGIAALGATAVPEEGLTTQGLWAAGLWEGGKIDWRESEPPGTLEDGILEDCPIHKIELTGAPWACGAGLGLTALTPGIPFPFCLVFPNRK